MSAASQPVFLSYASQDAEAARKICDALRAAGVEVWFDQSELRGGDAWDAQIRKRIKECALFVPLISPTTNSRPEGYFRLEWKLAVDRSHLLAEDHPFLFPVVIGDVTDATARVPDKFRDVQWTRLRLDETPAELAGRIAGLLSGSPVEAGRPRPAERVAAASRRNNPTWLRVAWSVVGLIFALVFVLKPMWQRSRSKPEPKPVVAAPAPPAAPAAEEKKAAKLNAARVALARFENLSGDAALDSTARIIEGELVHAIAAAPQVRLVPIEAAGRSAARAAARAENAAAVIVGSFYREGANLLVSAEVVEVEQGTLLGSLGPVTVPPGLRGEAWSEFSDRLITGANNATASLASSPLKLSGLLYSRPWPRWSEAQQLQRLRADETLRNDVDRVAAYRALLAKYPELILGKLDLARLLRGLGRMDEAEKELNELMAQRSQLSEVELYAAYFDLAVLQGKPEEALAAARGTLAIRNNRNEITQVLASLWALNRPRAAYDEIKKWWDEVKAQFTPEQRFNPEVGVRATQIASDLAHEDLAAAGNHLEELRKFATGRPIPTLTWMQSRLFAMQGRIGPLKALIAEAGALPAGARVEPALLAASAEGVLLHHGFTKDAAELQALLKARLADLPESVRESDELAEVNWRVALLEHRYDDVLKKIDAVGTRQVASPVDILGYKALTLLLAGREAEWRAVDAQLAKTELRNTRGLPLYWRARLAAANGEKKRATDLMELAVANGVWFRTFSGGISDYGRVEPEFAGLRGYAPYEFLLKPKD